MKMKLAYSIGYVLTTAVLFFSQNAYATHAREYHKTIKKEFDIHPQGTTSLINKYGKMDIKTWDKNRVRIDVRISVKARNEETAQQVFDRIDINFLNAEKMVKAVTFIEPRRRSWWGGQRSGDKIDYSINYEVYLPKTNQLQLQHRYGEVYIGDLEGKADLIVKYANLKIGVLADDSRILLAYGNGSVERSKDLDLDLNFSKFYIRKARDARIKSRYSGLQIIEANLVECSTKYDDYDLGKVQRFINTGLYDNIDIQSVDEVRLQSKYTEITAGRIRDALWLNLEKGKASCGIAADFSEVSIVGNYTDVQLNLAPGLSASIDAEARNAGIRYPEDFKVVYEKERQDSHELKAETGAAARKGKIKAMLSYGGLRIISQ